MAKGTRNKGGGGTTTNKEVNKENHKNIADNRQQNNSTDHPSNVKGGGRPHRNKQKIVVSIRICATQCCLNHVYIPLCTKLTHFWSQNFRKTKIQR